LQLHKIIYYRNSLSWVFEWTKILHIALIFPFNRQNKHLKYILVKQWPLCPAFWLENLPLRSTEFYEKSSSFFMTFVLNYLASKRWGKVGHQELRSTSFEQEIDSWKELVSTCCQPKNLSHLYFFKYLPSLVKQHEYWQNYVILKALQNH
jgi:hypothetical protein